MAIARGDGRKKMLGAKPAGNIDLKPNTKVTLVVTMYTNFDSKDWKQKAITVANTTTQTTVSQLRKDHVCLVGAVLEGVRRYK